MSLILVQEGKEEKEVEELLKDCCFWTFKKKG